jgi:Fe-S-cluster-containing dehydrogenase component
MTLDLSRRSALKLLSANIALIVAGCGKPPEEVLPYVHMPERLVAGVPLQFASTLPLGGYGRGVLCSSVDGRPIKISGNPLHPASLGSTDLFAEAHVLSLYDPDRSQACRRGSDIAAWVDLQTALAERLGILGRTGGDGLRLLTGPLTSPTVLRQIEALRQKFPKLLWHVHDPLEDAAGRQGAALAFGRELQIVPRLGDADVLVTLDADPLGPGPAQIVNGRGFADRRRVRTGGTPMARLYAIEAAPTLTGANADHRLTLRPGEIAEVAVAIARALGADLREPALPAERADTVAIIARDLQTHPGRALLLAGPSLPAEVHALVHWINAKLSAPVSYAEPLRPATPSLAMLEDDLAAGRVDTLLISGCNPAYDAPADSRIRELIGKATLAVHHGLYWDETARLCGWHVPDSHPLESWGDLRAIDGTASMVQPLIRPLYGSRTLAGLLAALDGNPDADDYDLVRATWAGHGGAEGFEPFWRKALHDGVVAWSASPPVDPGEPKLVGPPAAAVPTGFTLLLRPDPTLFDGSFANNAWLQECPKPLTKEVWGNSLGLNAEDAASLGVTDGDTLRLRRIGREILASVRIAAGHAPGVLSLALGHGRRAAGQVGTGVGTDAYALRTAADLWRLGNVEAAKASGGPVLFSTQKQFAIDGDREDIFPVLRFGELPAAPLDSHPGPVPSLLPRPDYAQAAARWAMVIDASSCIGCNACVLACQVENNVPVVGPEEIARNRDMHWLRIDAYDLEEQDGRAGFQPVPCMQCETAPCEPVCPVGASVHDSEGLNVQVYNRCVGTRFCEANCPYKVRRFNFFGYADGQDYANLGAKIMQAHNNPDVTVRARGVMEKCTYCVQRISGARREAEKENRPLREGDVTTACQNACPTQAIAFGDLNDQASAVARLRTEPQHFTLLGHLDTKPRTTYLADIRNPNPDLVPRLERADASQTSRSTESTP